MIIDAKPFDQMTLAELRHEHKYWDEIINNAIGWGSAYQVAIDFRTGCAAMIARREREEGDRTVVPHGTHHPETTSRKILRTMTFVPNR
jgi:hypothetical protein